MEIVKYKPLHEIKTFSGKSYFIDSENIDKFFMDMQKSKFIFIWENIVNVSSIDTIDKVEQEISLLEQMIAWKSDELKKKVRDTVKEREKEKLEITQGIIANIIKKYELS